MALPPSPHQSPLSKQIYNSKQTVMAQQLLTPEESALDSFNDARSLPSIRSIVEPSTPESPAFRNFSRDASFSTPDRVLYPDHTAIDATQTPLFEGSPSLSPSSASPISTYSQRTPSQPLRPGTASTRVEELFDQNPMGYWRDRMSEIDEMRAARKQRELPPLPQQPHQFKRDPFTARQLSMLNTNHATTLAPLRTTVARNAPVPKSQFTLAATASPTSIKRKRRPPPDTRAMTPESKPRTRAPATKKKEGPNADSWFEVRDVCPHISSLDASNMSLVLPEWRNNQRVLDLINDPDRGHLDSRELELASVLRLHCNMYLLCKRRIFVAKLHALQEGKEFNKTAAQNVCTIDVNKVSKMWTAFHRVGWFDERWFKDHM